ncbi:MAG: hypothetical protein HYU57_07285 [Micavibrio aeruginosavorus]|nr:hypothetical protein [Micavibrio aeruginosavorus]
MPQTPINQPDARGAKKASKSKNPTGHERFGARVQREKPGKATNNKES